MISGDMLNKIEDILSKAESNCDIEISSIADCRQGWLVVYKASDQSWGWLVAYLTKVSDLDGYYKLHWHEPVETEYNAFPS